jgi:hypothetical protein
VMMVSAVFSFWSLRLFPGRGTLGFTARLSGQRDDRSPAPSRR